MDARAVAVALSLATLGCEESPPTTPSGSATPTVRIVFMGATARRTDLPALAQACVSGCRRDAHASELAQLRGHSDAARPSETDTRSHFNDVPVDTRVSFRVNDQNACDENPTGAVTRNVFANDVRLIENTTTPGNGDEPGFAFSVAPNGAISQ